MICGSSAIGLTEGVSVNLFDGDDLIIGQRFDLDHKWMAFVPVLGFFVLTSAAGLTHWFVLVIFIPFINWLVAPILFTRICRATGQNEIKGWLTIVPILGWIMTWAIAYDAPWNSRPL